jgi:hypothetical protein
MTDTQEVPPTNPFINPECYINIKDRKERRKMYNKYYYASNKQELLRKKRERYNNDEEYRIRQLKYVWNSRYGKKLDT